VSQPAVSAQIAGRGLDPTGVGGSEFGQALLVASDGKDLRALGHRRLDGCPADSAAGAGKERRPSGQSEIHRALLPRRERRDAGYESLRVDDLSR
jgi:hypothetical protein